ncbi:MAG: LamG domain-containing protein, partial [Armatimonadetes bacterium]|nr:LamG domain-containing protein [Armatimonadota bacterium]
MRGLWMLHGFLPTLMMVFVPMSGWTAPPATLNGLVARYNFDEPSGSVVRDLSGNRNDGTLRGGAARSPGLLQGGVQFGGVDGWVEIPDSPSLHLRDGLTISLWVKPGRIRQDPEQKGDCQTLVSKNWNWRSRIDHRGRIATILGGENWDASKQEMQWVLPAEKDVWCHIVYVFSRDEKRMRLYRDGQKIDERTHVIVGLRDESGQPLLLGLDVGGWNPLLGCMDEVQVYNRALTEEEIAALPVSVSLETLLFWDQTLERSRAQLRRSVSSRKTDRDLATRITRQVSLARQWIAGEKAAETRDLSTGKFRQFSALLQRIEGTAAALAQGRAPLKRAVAYAVKPVTATLRLPNSFPAKGIASDTFHVVAAPGEFEPVSFVLAAWGDLRRLTFQIGNLRGKASSIPAASVDLRVVKCWYQSGSAWQDVFQDRQHRVLVPELLLHDDSLVKVDDTRRENLVKCRFSEGERYVCISRIPTGAEDDDPASMREARGRTIPNRVFPVQDRASLQPLDIQEGTCRQ